MTVIATTSILFVLATTLMMMVAYQTSSTTVRGARLSATHVADAGINAYLYELKSKPGYFTTTPDTGPIGVGDGQSYRVIAVPPGNGQPLTLYSTGSTGDGTVTVAATVKFPTFADFMFMSNADIRIGTGATINGKVHSNANITNEGHITGKVTAVGTITNTGILDMPSADRQAKISFEQVLVDMDNIRLSAVGNTSYFPASATLGYRAVVSGNTVTVSEITAGTTTGNLTLKPYRTLAVPASGALYFADDVWVSGSYSVPLTIVSNENIYIPNNYAPANMSSTVTGGLIARLNIIVPCWYSSVPQNMVLTAAMLSQGGRITADMKTGVFRDKITITGSETYWSADGGFVTVNTQNGADVAGFHARTYSYDERLDDFPPPKYPIIQDGTLKVATWTEDNSPQ
jgi:hypothetical protein